MLLQLGGVLPQPHPSSSWNLFCTKAIKFHYYSENQSNVEQIIESIEYNLFRSKVENINHSLHYLLPPRKQVQYNLRKRGDFTQKG